MSFQQPFVTTILTTKPKMETWELEILEKREIRKTTVKTYIGCAVDWLDLQ